MKKARYTTRSSTARPPAPPSSITYDDRTSTDLLQPFGFRIWGFESGVESLGFGVPSLKVRSSWFGVSNFGVQISGFGSRVWGWGFVGFGFRAAGFRLRLRVLTDHSSVPSSGVPPWLRVEGSGCRHRV